MFGEKKHVFCSFYIAAGHGIRKGFFYLKKNKKHLVFLFRGNIQSPILSDILEIKKTFEIKNNREITFTNRGQFIF